MPYLECLFCAQKQFVDSLIYDIAKIYECACCKSNLKEFDSSDDEGLNETERLSDVYNKYRKPKNEKIPTDDPI